jgi:hypothetical protein
MKRFFTFFTVLLVAVTAMAQGTRTYGIKSGEYKTEMDMMGQKVVATVWFDDYGAKQLTKTKTSMMGMVLDMGSLNLDGKTYMINYADKQVQEMPTQESINYMDLNEEVIAKYKIVMDGVEEIAGKECLVMTAEINQMGQTAKVKASVWEGIPMKTVTSSMGMTITTTVTELKEGPVDASLFVLPEY